MSSFKIGTGLSKILRHFGRRISNFELRALTALLLGLLFILPLRAEKPAHVQPAPSEEFFIISSVDASKQQLVLKRPTEVTELVGVTDRTAYLDEQRSPLPFRDLRAGDTVYVTLSGAGDGPRVASRIRKAPMTVEELHRRYLKAVTSEE